MKVLFIIVLMNALVFSQDVLYNHEFRLNSFGNNSQSSPEISWADDSVFLACWVSKWQQGEHYSVRGRIFSKNAIKLGSELKISTNPSVNVMFPDIAYLSNGNFVVCWQSTHEYGSDNGIYAQIVSKNGENIGSEFQVDTHVNSKVDSPVISALNEGNFIICYQRRSLDSDDDGIYAQKFYSTGEKWDEEFLVSTPNNLARIHSSVGKISNPSISRLYAGGIIVTWTSYGQDGSNFGVYGQIFNDNVQKIGNEFLINTFTENRQFNSDVSGLNNGGFIVVWQSQEQAGNTYSIYGQLFDSLGAKLGNEFKANTYSDSYQENPAVASLSDGRFVVCWQSFEQDGNGFGVFGQIFYENSSKYGTEFRINSTTKNSQLNPGAASSHSNKIFSIYWQSYLQDGSSYASIAKYFLEEELDIILQEFSLIMPLPSSTLYVPSVEFQWTAANATPLNLPWEIDYTLYLDSDSSFSSPIIIDSLYQSSYVIEYLQPGNIYYWKVLAKNIAGDSLLSSETYSFFIDPNATTIENVVNTNPQGFKLHQNYPNPFNPETIINYKLPARSAGGGITNFVKLTVLDITGREVATLVNKQLPAGKHSVTFNAANLASGVYFYHIRVGDYQETKKMLLLR